MLSEAMAALAAAGGTAVVQAAGTDAWTELRRRVARWFGREDPQSENVALERLDQTARELQTAAGSEVERVRIRQEAAWQTRIEARLESLADTERPGAAEELRTLLAPHTSHNDASADRGGLAVGGNMDIRVEKGSVGVGFINGDMRIDHHPPTPDPSQG